MCWNLRFYTCAVQYDNLEENKYGVRYWQNATFFLIRRESHIRRQLTQKNVDKERSKGHDNKTVSNFSTNISNHKVISTKTTIYIYSKIRASFITQ